MLKPFKYYLKLREVQLDISILAVLLLIFSIYLIGNPAVFTKYDIYYSFMSTIPFSGIMALAMTFVVTLGLIDLSFPSVLAYSSWIFGIVFKLTGNIYLALLCCLLTGVIAGLLNCLLIVKFKIPSIVATIGTMFFWRGLVNVCAQGKNISLVKAKESIIFHNLFVGRLFGVIPAQAIWFLGLGILFWFILKRHKFGSHLLFVGDNEASSEMMGINVNLVKIIVFVSMGFFAAFAGVFSTLEVNYFWPSQGAGYLMPTLAAVFIGGTSVYGGEGTIFGTIIGVLIIGSLEAGIIAIGLTGFWIQLIYGMIIILSVTIYSILLKKSK
jgi:simple sugar transport system permease protein